MVIVYRHTIGRTGLDYLTPDCKKHILPDNNPSEITFPIKQHNIPALSIPIYIVSALTVWYTVYQIKVQ